MSIRNLREKAMSAVKQNRQQKVHRLMKKFYDEVK